MNRLTLIIWTVAFVMICHLQGTAQNLVTPPSGLPQERWELTYNDYRAPIYEQSIGYFQSITADYPRIPPHDDLINLKKEVVIVRDGNDIYIKGIFAVYPNAWIKCKVSGDRLNIGDNQIIDLNGSVYFHCGNLSYWYPHDASSVTLQFTFEPMSEIKVFQATEDGKGFEDELGCYFPTFWYNDDPEGTVRFYSTWKDGKVEGTGFPEFDCVANFGFDY